MNLGRLTAFVLAAFAALAAPSAHAIRTPIDTTPAALSEPLVAVADPAPADAWLIEAVYPVGQAPDGDCIELAVLVEPETHTRVWCYVKSPLGLKFTRYCNRAGNKIMSVSDWGEIQFYEKKNDSWKLVSKIKGDKLSVVGGAWTGVKEGLSLEGRAEFYGERMYDPNTTVGQLVAGDIYGNEIYPAPGVGIQISGKTGRFLHKLPGFRNIMWKYNPAQLAELYGSFTLQAVYVPDEGAIVYYVAPGVGPGFSAKGKWNASLGFQMFGVYGLHAAGDYERAFLDISAGGTLPGKKGVMSGTFDWFVSPGPTDTGYHVHGQGFTWTPLSFDSKPDVTANVQFQWYFEVGRQPLSSPDEWAEYMKTVPKNERGDRIWSPLQWIDTSGWNW
mgnify:CR=1 FL=1